MATVDELGRSAAATLRRSVEVDGEAGLRRLHESAPAPDPRHRRWWALAGAAAVVLLGCRRLPGDRSLATAPRPGDDAGGGVDDRGDGDRHDHGCARDHAGAHPTSTAPETTATIVASTSTAPVVPPAAGLALFAAPAVL